MTLVKHEIEEWQEQLEKVSYSSHRTERIHEAVKWQSVQEVRQTL